MKKLILAILIFTSVNLKAQTACSWAYLPDSAASHDVSYVAIDHGGNIIQLGRILGVADMDPAPGIADTSFSPPGVNFYMSKTSVSGHLMWIRYFTMNAPVSNFSFNGLKINSENDIVITGNYFGVVDFDLTPGGYDTLRSHFPTYPDYFLASYDSSLNLEWAFTIGNGTTSNMESHAMCIQANDNIVISGVVSGSTPVDIDPDSTAVHNSIGNNTNLVCYDGNGHYVWNSAIVTTYSYPVDGETVSCDYAGNVYVMSVGYYELTVTKFDNLGQFLWEKTIGDFAASSRVNPQSIMADPAGNGFYVAGTFSGTVDFDPDVVFTINKTASSSNYDDAFISYYDSSMHPVWINAYAGNVSFGADGLTNVGSNIIAVGDMKGVVDYGNGYIFTSPTYAAPFEITLDNTGTTIDGFYLNGSGSFGSIDVLPTNEFVVNGHIAGTVDMDPSASTVTLTTQYSKGFVAVYQNIPLSSSSLNKIPFTVYPNPSNGIFRINFENVVNGNLSVYNCKGEKVDFMQLSSANTVVDMQQFAAGIYFVKISDGMEENNFKIIIQ